MRTISPFSRSTVGLAGSGLLGIALATAAGPAAGRAEGPGAVDFDRDVRPILRDRCFTCHGPDENQRKAKLRLDRAEGLFRELDEELWIVAGGDLDRSELWTRVTDPEAEWRMPPEDEGEPLSDAELEILRQWIEQGADWSEHWAFVPPERPPVPAVSNESWPRGEVDRFVLARLEREGLTPSPEAAKEALIRRASFDLTGLPPTLAELDAFLADDSPAAFERVIDRLLASPRYGERMAALWLDLARYADTNGYHIDNHRDMWKWREWVIAAFNQNQPFDRFTVEQLAGDLLPEPTLDQLVATGFNRNGPINFEGGADPDEYQTKYVVDRVVTTSTVWMGLTMACAECHDHKYDPISTREFYQLYAFFNTIPERGLDGQRSNPVPSIRVPAPEQEAELAALARAARGLEDRLAAPDAQIDAEQLDWERGALASQPDWRPLTPDRARSSGGAEVELLADAVVRVSGPNPDTDVHEWEARPGPGPIWALRIEALADADHFEGRVGRAENGNAVVTGIEVELGDRPVRPAAIVADFSQPGDEFQVSNLVDDDPANGWALGGHQRPGGRQAVLVFSEPLEPGAGVLRLRLRYESVYAGHALGRFRVSAADAADFARGIAPPHAGPWQVIGPFTAESGELAFDTAYPPEQGEQGFDPEAVVAGGLTWRSEPEWVDGQGHELAGFNAATYLHRTIESDGPREVQLALGSDDAIRVWLNGELVHSNEVARGLAPDQDRVTVRLRDGANELLMKIVNYGGAYGFHFRVVPPDGAWLDPPLVAALARAPDERSTEQVEALRAHYRRTVSAGGMELHAAAERAALARAEFEASLPETMVMREMAEPRTTHLLARGDFRRKGEELQPEGPGILPPIPRGGERATRLDLARWLVAPEHPLTARVAVNRYWQMLFGAGLVKTSEDFGARGERPSHPELLDWLAREYADGGWDTKALLETLMLSASYRQTARVGPALLERDPDNRLLARGPRTRLTAEMIRDQALFVSGLLAPDIGGPSVRPYQPPGLWEAVGFGNEYSSQSYVQDRGELLYRRGLYVYWKRAMPYPSMRIFDAPIRETCTTRRPYTNTPLQALALQNDPTYVEAARGLGERLLSAAGATDDEMLVRAFRTCTSRHPTERELGVLRRVLAEQREAWDEFVDAHAFLRVGEHEVPDDLEPCELAAWSALANMLLNLDAALHKG